MLCAVSVVVSVVERETVALAEAAACGVETPVGTGGGGRTLFPVGDVAGTVTCGNGRAVSCSTARTPNHEMPTAAVVAHNQANVIAAERTADILHHQHWSTSRGADLPDAVSQKTTVVLCTTVANVLLIEDEPAVRTALIRFLSEASHCVRSVGTALEALREVTQQCPDVVVLDLGLPDLGGAEALKMMHGVSDVPVIVATARDEEAEIVRLLNNGADDYLIKPFSGDHLNARLTAVLRRTRRSTDKNLLVVGGLRIDVRRRQAQLDGLPLDLVRREFDLLAYLAARPGEVVPRRELLSRVWHQPYGEDQTIDVHLSWLRRKMGERAAEARYLHTIRGVGVKLDAPQPS